MFCGVQFMKVGNLPVNSESRGRPAPHSSQPGPPAGGRGPSGPVSEVDLAQGAHGEAVQWPSALALRVVPRMSLLHTLFL